MISHHFHKFSRLYTACTLGDMSPGGHLWIQPITSLRLGSPCLLPSSSPAVPLQPILSTSSGMALDQTSWFLPKAVRVFWLYHLWPRNPLLSQWRSSSWTLILQGCHHHQLISLSASCYSSLPSETVVMRHFLWCVQRGGIVEELVWTQTLLYHVTF